MNRRLIKGVGIDLDHPTVKDVKSHSEIKKLDLFNHLSESEQEEASKELLTALNTKEEKDEQSDEQND